MKYFGLIALLGIFYRVGLVPVAKCTVCLCSLKNIADKQMNEMDLNL